MLGHIHSHPKLRVAHGPWVGRPWILELPFVLQKLPPSWRTRHGWGLERRVPVTPLSKSDAPTEGETQTATALLLKVIPQNTGHALIGGVRIRAGWRKQHHWSHAGLCSSPNSTTWGKFPMSLSVGFLSCNLRIGTQIAGLSGSLSVNDNWHILLKTFCPFSSLTGNVTLGSAEGNVDTLYRVFQVHISKPTLQMETEPLFSSSGNFFFFHLPLSFGILFLSHLQTTPRMPKVAILSQRRHGAKANKHVLWYFIISLRV